MSQIAQIPPAKCSCFQNGKYSNLTGNNPTIVAAMQVWKGALLLSDVVLSLGARLSACTILELGCGAGLTGICAAMSAKQVILTDVGYDILENCEVVPLHF